MTDVDVLVAEDVRRRYGETVALDGVSLSVGAGEVFCLIGPNGAGKTTVVRALTGTTDYEGQVAVFGRTPTETDRSRIGLLPQAFAPPSRLTARELLTYYGGLYEEARDPDSLLADLGLEASADVRYENLSGGQRRRVCVGTTLVNDPELLFLDEPTAGIDPAGQRSLWVRLEELVADGTTILLTTHDMAEAERLADRVGLLADGSLLAVDTPEELIAAHGGKSRLAIDTVDAPDSGVRALREAGYRAESREVDIAVYDVPPEGIGSVVETLDARGIEYDGLAWNQPTLEDAYLRLTGTAVGASGDPVDATTDANAGVDPDRTAASVGTDTATGPDANASASTVGDERRKTTTDAERSTRKGTPDDSTDESMRARPGDER